MLKMLSLYRPHAAAQPGNVTKNVTKPNLERKGKYS